MSNTHFYAFSSHLSAALSALSVMKIHCCRTCRLCRSGTFGPFLQPEWQHRQSFRVLRVPCRWDRHEPCLHRVPYRLDRHIRQPPIHKYKILGIHSGCLVHPRESIGAPCASLLYIPQVWACYPGYWGHSEVQIAIQSINGR